MTKFWVTQQQRDNLLEALNVMWPSVPPENVPAGLSVFRQDFDYGAPNCGTVACFGGWCAWWPSFRAQGVWAGDVGRPEMEAGFPGDVSELLFGHAMMFKARGHAGMMDVGFRGTDHELVIHRLNWLLENSEVAA